MAYFTNAQDTNKPANIPQINSVTVYPLSQGDTAQGGDRIVINGKYFDALLAKETAENPIVLYLDNYKLNTLTGELVDDSNMSFTLGPVAKEDVDFWTNEYTASLKQNGKIRPILKIGTMDGVISSKPYTNFYLRIYRPEMKLIISWTFIIISILLIFFAYKTDILREACECNCAGKTKKGKQPFSLSRTQMAFWTMIVGFSFTYIYLISGEMPEITQGTLILLGISSSTTLGGFAINSSTAKKNGENVKAEKCCSEGFIKDILSDGGNLGIYRLQNVLFTLILGVIYISKAVNYVEMTEFKTNLLFLMGISSGTYLGVKYFANQSPDKTSVTEDEQEQTKS